MTPETTCRPWPLPQRPWVMAMRWHDLMFMHWPIRPEALRPLIPAMLGIGHLRWLGLARCRAISYDWRTPALSPSLPLSAFPEINVRTYVKTPGRSGVWFFSLDAANRSQCARRATGMACHITTHACVWCKRAPRCIITVRGRIARRPPRPLRRAILPAVRSITQLHWSTGSRRAIVCML